MSLARRPGPSVRVRVTESAADRERSREDRVAVEEPLEFRLEWPGAAAHRVWTTMRTPGHDFELAAGWVHHEGLGRPDRVAYCTDATLRPEQEFNVVTVTLDAAPAAVPHQHEAVGAGSSACGVCGRDSLDAALAVSGTRWAGSLPAADVVRGLPDLLRQGQGLFDRTGGVHAAGLFDAEGELLCLREDVGRHNAVDKVVGWALREGRVPLRGTVLQVSGRASFELAQKAHLAGIPVLSAVSAPSSLAVEHAASAGMTLVAFNRGGHFNAYGATHRIG